MSSSFKDLLGDELYEAATDYSVRQGRGVRSTKGLSGLIRMTVRYWLNKNGYKFDSETRWLNRGFNESTRKNDPQIADTIERLEAIIESMDERINILEGR
jgi:hypothetical protein